jgi:hypothetical protein
MRIEGSKVTSKAKELLMSTHYDSKIHFLTPLANCNQKVHVGTFSRQNFSSPLESTKITMYAKLAGWWQFFV